MKCLELKILHSRRNKFYGILITSYKTNEISRIENISCMAEWNGPIGNTSCKANEISRSEKNSCEVI